MTLRLERHPTRAPANWDEAVRRLGGGIFHSTAWAEYQRQTRDLQPLFLLAYDEDGKVCGASLAFLRQSRRPIASWIFRDLTLPAHPAVQDSLGPTTTRFVEACERLGRDLGCRHIGIESFMSGHSSFGPAEHGYVESHRLEFSLDLTRDAETLWKGIRKDQRERIRRLPREGIILEVGSTLEDLRGLGSARESTQEKRSRQGQGYELESDDRLYDHLYEHLVKQGAARLFVARREREVVAALFFAVFNGRAYSVYSGSTDQGYKLGAQSGLFWMAVESFKAEGFHELNRGGVPASAERESDPLHGIYLFKLRLGTVPQLCRSGRKILSPMRDRLARLGDRLRGLGGRA